MPELSNDEILNNNSTLNVNDTDVTDDPEVSNVEYDLNLPVLDNIEDPSDENDNETNKYEAGSTYISTGKSTDIPTEAFEDFGVGDSFLLTEELNEVPTQAPLSNGNEDSEPELGEKKRRISQLKESIVLLSILKNQPKLLLKKLVKILVLVIHSSLLKSQMKFQFKLHSIMERMKIVIMKKVSFQLKVQK